MSTILRNATILILAVWFASCSNQDIGLTEDGTFVTGSVEQSASTERGIIPGARAVVIEGFSGNIRVVGTTGENANFIFTKRARASNSSDATKLIDKISIEEAGDENTFTLTMSSPEKERTAVDIDATIPADTPIIVKYSSGTIELRAMNGSLDVSNTAGSIIYSGEAESLTLQTRNGDVRASLSNPDRLSSGKLDTSNGDIVISVPIDASLGVDATTSAGAVRNESLTFTTRALSTNGAGSHFQGQIGSANEAKLIAKTYHGDISFGLLDAVDVPIVLDQPADSNTTSEESTIETEETPMSDGDSTNVEEDMALPTSDSTTVPASPIDTTTAAQPLML